MAPRTYKTRGLVLRWRPYSNTSQIVTAFTRDLGVVSFLARGSSRLSRRSSSFPSPFDLAGWYDIVLRRGGGELELATESRLVEGFDHVRHDLRAYLETCFALEIVNRLFRPRDPHPEFLRGLLSFLKLLGVGTGRLSLRVHLVGTALRESGFEPVLTECVECGESLDPTVPAVQVRLPAGIVCDGCALPRDLTFHPDVIAYLLDDSRAAWGIVPSVETHPRTVSAAWAFYRELLIHHLESLPRSLSFLRG